MKGTPTFIAQVSDGLPEAPNLWPAMKTTFFTRGRSSSCSRSSRSQARHSTPHEVSFSRKPRSEKRATPTTRLPARRAMRASVGPILPPMPSTRISSTPARSAFSCAEGCVRKQPLVQAAVERLGAQAQRMAGAIGELARIEMRIQQDQVVALGRAREKVAAIGDQDAGAGHRPRAEVIARHLDHGGVDLDHVEAHVGKVMIQETDQRAAAQSDEQHRVRLRAIDEARGHGLRVGMLQPVGLAQIDQRLDQVELLVADEVERAPGAVVDHLDVRVVGLDLVDQDALAGAEQQAQRYAEGDAPPNMN